MLRKDVLCTAALALVLLCLCLFAKKNAQALMISRPPCIPERICSYQIVCDTVPFQVNCSTYSVSCSTVSYEVSCSTVSVCRPECVY